MRLVRSIVMFILWSGRCTAGMRGSAWLLVGQAAEAEAVSLTSAAQRVSQLALSLVGTSAGATTKKRSIVGKVSARWCW